jgi:hypothetical protein
VRRSQIRIFFLTDGTVKRATEAPQRPDASIAVLVMLSFASGSRGTKLTSVPSAIEVRWTAFPLQSALRSSGISDTPKRESPSGGMKYEILGVLRGPNGRAAAVRSIWIVLHGETRPRLVTLVPWEEG